MAAKNILRIIFLLTASSLVAFGFIAIEDYQAKLEKETATQLSAFQFSRLDGKPFSNQNLDAKRPLIINYFNPSCHLCQEEAALLHQHRQTLANYQILFVSAGDSQETKAFYHAHQLDAFSNAKVLLDSDAAFDHYFGNTSFPTLIAYDPQGNLLFRQSGQVDFDRFLKALTP